LGVIDPHSLPFVCLFAVKLADVTQRQLPSQTEQFMRVLQRHLPELRRTYGVRALWLFGSNVRGDETQESDLDVLVEFDDRSLSLFKFIELENQLSDLLGVRVDLVEKKGLKPAIGRRILSEVVPV
jgi:predicted nucleotidyltransferase